MRPKKVTARGLLLRSGLAVAALVAAPVLSAPAPRVGSPASAPATTATELIARMDAALPREGTVVLSGKVRVATGNFRVFSSPKPIEPLLFGRQQQPQGTAFRQTLSFKPGFYVSHRTTGAATRSGEQSPLWTVSRADGSLLTAHGDPSDPSLLTGVITLDSLPAAEAYELLFQPRRVQDWLDPATLLLQRTATHFQVTGLTRSVQSRPGSVRSVLLEFSQDRTGHDLPHRIVLSDAMTRSETQLHDFRRSRSGHVLPGRFVYRRSVGPIPMTGSVTVESFSPRPDDAPPLPSTMLTAQDIRRGGPEFTRMRLNEAPPPLWLLTAQDDLRRGVVSLPYLGRVPVRQYFPLALPMALLLGMALLQRKRMRAGQASRARWAGAARRIVMALRRPEKPR